MSVMCPCLNCGGNDQFAMCENALLEAFAKSGSRMRPGLGAEILVYGSAIMILLLLFISVVSYYATTTDSF